MATAVLNGEVLAESGETIVVEGNHYFPPDSIKADLFSPTSTESVCPWKGTASYYSVRVGEADQADVAWYYPAPKDAAAEIKDYVAFYAPPVEVTA